MKIVFALQKEGHCCVFISLLQPRCASRGSRTAINGILQALWHELDAFASERSGPAWKQVERHLLTRSGHGSRQERCEMEQAGRILRAQATRKQVFLTILPLLSEGLIRPADGKRPARKDYRAISEQVRALRADLDDPDAFMALTNVLEQACNVYLQTGAFPATYEQMQRVPVQEVAQLTFAGDDGMTLGQTYRMRLSWEHCCDLASRHEHTCWPVAETAHPRCERGVGLGGVEPADRAARSGLRVSGGSGGHASSHLTGNHEC